MKYDAEQEILPRFWNTWDTLGHGYIESSSAKSQGESEE